MHKQRGVSLSGLMIWGFILAMVSLVLIKVAPSAIEFYKIRKDVKAVVQNAPPNATVPELRRSFEKYAEIDVIKDVRPEDLDIAKEGNQIVISFAYEKKIRLFGPVSVLIDYQGSSAGQ
ncbi:DUF4845 domain-containing protein [Azospira restricta]|uniref:DUF4845 domain-containing protein n=1 Tax=Azospira restricta TaxID=404405 RepID=A0A974SMM1_9RHOO|nr:DUF4845 domain-containing protein [Azospira restricta]QRJ62800.1 DUF4845 domain-containing protein [Azospira restricta]